MKKAPVGTVIGVMPCLNCHHPVTVKTNKNGYPYPNFCNHCQTQVLTKSAHGSQLLLGRVNQWEPGADELILEAGEAPLLPDRPMAAPSKPVKKSGPNPAPTPPAPKKSFWDREI